ncbi:hypothetical protein OIU34_18510 [Pararhizobium sp. BT-229]|uniref:hypothetical protein n=1 Tax=Pararhizobium sp. BT-229 TaxID=2986923 RepID=UPI0021F79C09|nr:hypothetical protein [Pararhizobium sp. BT-229]MCV9963872.1 hypothetical protein [Pararhizobium sp. BT-229]
MIKGIVVASACFSSSNLAIASSMPTPVGTVEKCQFEKPDANDLVVLIDGFDSFIKTDVWLSADPEWGGQHTSWTELQIEDGDQPLYIIAYSVMPRVWHFTGKTSRIKKVIVLRNPSPTIPLVGVVGLDRSVVDFDDRSLCKPVAPDWPVAGLETALGHKINLIPQNYRVNNIVLLPSDRVPKEGGNHGLSSQVTRSFIVHFDPTNVIVPEGTEEWPLNHLSTSQIQEAKTHLDGAIEILPSGL